MIATITIISITAFFAYIARRKHKIVFWVSISLSFFATTLCFTGAPGWVKFVFPLMAAAVIFWFLFLSNITNAEGSLLNKKDYKKDFREPGDEPEEDIPNHLSGKNPHIIDCSGDGIRWGHGWW